MEKSIASEDYRVFLRCLRNARKRAKLTQIQVAERLGVPQSFVSKTEIGERRLDLVEARAFCLAVGISFQAFVEGFERELGREKGVRADEPR